MLDTRVVVVVVVVVVPKAGVVYDDKLPLVPVVYLVVVVLVELVRPAESAATPSPVEMLP